MTGGQLNANADQYLQANGLNVPPPPITSDPLVSGATPIEQLLRVLGLAANAGDPGDNSESTDGYAERDLKTAEAAAKFPAQDEEAAAEMTGIAGQGDTTQMAQQFPQMAAGIAGALAGAIGGALQPLAQIPQQVAQGAQQAMQAGMGLMQQAGGSAGQLDEASLSDVPLDEFGSDTAALEGGAASGGDLGGGGGGGTTPTAMLGPPPVPSAGTYPSSAPVMPSPPPGAAAPAAPTSPGMAGMPMVPPGAMHGVGSTDKDAKPDTKRVSVPAVKNGAPVQGRIAVSPPLPNVTKLVAGKPVATRRIATAGDTADKQDSADDGGRS